MADTAGRFEDTPAIEAESLGCRIVNGLGMSLYQGVAQIKLWSGQDAPVDVMRQELMDILAGK